VRGERSVRWGGGGGKEKTQDIRPNLNEPLKLRGAASRWAIYSKQAPMARHTIISHGRSIGGGRGGFVGGGGGLGGWCSRAVGHRASPVGGGGAGGRVICARLGGGSVAHLPCWRSCSLAVEVALGRAMLGGTRAAWMGTRITVCGGRARGGWRRAGTGQFSGAGGVGGWCGRIAEPAWQQSA